MTRGRGSSGAARAPERGFTLIEVMVALAIVAFAFVALLGLHNRNILLVANGQQLAQATLRARELITQMELLEGFPDEGTSSGPIQGYPGFRWEREVRSTALDAVREVRLRVIWDDRIPDACSLIYYIRDNREPQA